jgi:hypothetical protein
LRLRQVQEVPILRVAASVDVVIGRAVHAGLIARCAVLLAGTRLRSGG